MGRWGFCSFFFDVREKTTMSFGNIWYIHDKLRQIRMEETRKYPPFYSIIEMTNFPQVNKNTAQIIPLFCTVSM